MQTLVIIFVMAFLVEALVEYGKLIFTKQINWTQLAALLLGVGVAFLFNADMFRLLGIPLVVPYAGVALTGILGSRGANYLADIVKRIQGLLNGSV